MQRSIIFVTPLFPPSVGGAATHFQALLDYCSKDESLVAIVLTTRSQSVARNERGQNFRVLRIIPNVVRSNAIARVVILPFATFCALVYGKFFFRPAVLHVHSSTAMTLGALLFSTLFRVPVVLDVQDLLMYPWVLSFGTIRYYLATGQAVRKFLEDRGVSRDKIMTIYSLPYPSPAPIPIPSIAVHQPILFVGELRNEIKGILVLLEAVKLTKRLIPDIGLEVVGAGPDRDRCIDFIRYNNLQDNVILRGALLHDETMRTINRCSFLAVPSFSEAMPRVILEAFSFGKTVIATPVGSIPEIVADKRNGLLVQPGHAEDLAKAIILLIKNTHFRVQLGQEAKATADALPSWKTMGEQLTRLYHQFGL